MADTIDRLDRRELAETGPAEAVRLPIDLIDPNPQNPRRDLAEIDALAQNIRAFGLLQPVTVRRAGDRYELLGGHRRHAAFNLLANQQPEDVQWRSIPAVIRTADDQTSYRMLLSGQLHQRGWTPREEAAALERLALNGLRIAQIGAALHKTEAWASRRLRVYADSILSGYVQTGQLASGVAEELLVIRDVETRKRLAERAVEEHWSQDQARGQARALRLDMQLSQIGRRAREMLELLSAVDPQQLPTTTARDLWALRGRIELLATGKKPRFPTIEEARRAAGMREQPARRRSVGGKPKRRTMPRPA